MKSPLLLGIPNNKRTEKELEEEIIKNISGFMNELGNDVYFKGRQYKLNINGLIHKIDLVFYDYSIDTFILIDLKVGKVSNLNIKQMQLYREYFSKGLNQKSVVIGLILCETMDSRLVSDNNIYQIKYLNELPKKKKLLQIISENKIILLKYEKLELK